jgi:hypothetical protein
MKKYSYVFKEDVFTIYFSIIRLKNSHCQLTPTTSWFVPGGNKELRIGF